MERNNKKILLVEDDQNFGAVLKDYLTFLGVKANFTSLLYPPHLNEGTKPIKNSLHKRTNSSF